MSDGRIPVSNTAGDGCRLFDGEFRSVAFLAKSLSDENRLRILLSISQGKRRWAALSTSLDSHSLSYPIISRN